MKTGLRAELVKIIDEGKFSCWTCGASLQYKDITMIDFDSKRICYECSSCGNHDGARSFKALGFSFDPKVINVNKNRYPFLIVVNGAPINANSAEKFLRDVFSGFGGNRAGGNASSSTNKPKTEVIVVKPASKKSMTVDLDSLGLNDGFGNALKDDINAIGEVRYWSETVASARSEGKTVVEYLKECEKDYLKHMKRGKKT